MLPAGFVEKLADSRQGFDDRLIGGDFAVKHTQGISDGAALAVGAHVCGDWFESFAQSFVVGGAIIWAADGVQLQRPVFDAEAIEERGQQFKNLGVARWGFAARAGRADALRADLIELAIPPLLWTLPPELRADVIELVQATIPKLV